MSDEHDLELVINSRVPLVVVESHEELRVLDLLRSMVLRLQRPLFHWTITQGLKRIDVDYAPQRHNAEAGDVLRHIKSAAQKAVYVLSDFHPYLKDPTNVRLLKDIALAYKEMESTLILLSHELEMPAEIRKFSARFSVALPGRDELERIIRNTAAEWARGHPGKQVKTDRKTLDALLRNLSGLPARDAQRLARNVIYDDGAITDDDLPAVMKAKYRLLNAEGMLAFEYETASFADVGGLRKLKQWLEHRRAVFHGELQARGLDPPKGVLLLGVQGCGKSLAAKAVAGVWNVPLLRLDFGALYNKYYGESERNLRESLNTAEVMAPCVLWMDEIEKGIASGSDDDGTSRRVLGTLLTWMAERKQPAFLVATANDIERLPPELIRKGRFDEIFFVDLPVAGVQAQIFAIHLKKRDLDPDEFDLQRLAQAADGFSGSEIEQAVVSALYTAHAQRVPLSTGHLLAEIEQTRPLSVVMAERIKALRSWAASRTVPAD